MARQMNHAALLGFVLAVAFSCSDGIDPIDAGDAGSDSGARQDTGSAIDAGAAADADAPDNFAPDAPPPIVPLFDEATELEPALVEDGAAALITRFADRGRDRHAREDQFQAYDHYLPLYWEHRTAQIEIIDTIGKGGDTIRFNITTEWRLQAMQAELRFFYRGIGAVAEYHDNRVMTRVDDLHYTHEASFNPREGRTLEVGDKLEFELSQFLDAPPRGRSNYYGTTFLYVAGEGIVPWIGSGALRDSEAIPARARLGGDTTVHAAESNEPEFAFSQMATNLAPDNGQRFVIGRRLAHTDFSNGRHDESPENPVWAEQANKVGPNYINTSCNACHERNGRALPPPIDVPLRRYVVKIGDAETTEHSSFGGVLQPTAGQEPDVSLASWIETDGLRAPTYAFVGEAPARFSARISPQLVGLGLLEAIPETAVQNLADPDDADGDGISGRIHVVFDAAQGTARLGRFGWKAGQPTVRQQTASALRTDMGVLSSVFPTHDCGSLQGGCGDEGPELDDEALEDLIRYVALLGVRPQRDFDNADVARGRELFEQAGCEGCHVAQFVTSSYAPLAELRAQTIAPYTDLLLHEMGSGLADDLPEGDATGAEWRTTPLWGIGRTAGVSGGEAYLHDGRARTLDEAIRWHGGEAESSRERYEELDAADQELLLRFLRTL